MDTKQYPHQGDTLIICNEGAWWLSPKDTNEFDRFYAERPDRAEVWEHLWRSNLGEKTYGITLREFVESGIEFGQRRSQEKK